MVPYFKVMLEDRTRSLCSLFKQTRIEKQGQFEHRITYEIESVWILTDLSETCESVLDKVLRNNQGLEYILKNGIVVA